MDIDYQSKISKVVNGIAPSAIRRFFDLANEMKGEVISLSIGEPDFVTPWNIREAGIFSLEDGNTHYSPNQGYIEVRKAISEYLQRRFELKYDPKSQILVTVGGSEALDLIARSLIDPGDEVIILEPCFVAYKATVTLAHGVPVVIETKEEDASIQGDDSLEIVDYPELKPSANQESYLLDVAQILNSDFSRSREPAVHGGIKKENKPFATSEENPSAVSASSHGLESVASTSKRRDLNNFVIGDVSQHKACRRQDPNKRLPIFRRFVDLATKRQQINAVDAEEIPVKRVETPTQDYSREICICDAYESANTIEVVVAPCYVGANVTFQNQ